MRRAKYERPMKARALGVPGLAFTEKVADAIRGHGVEDVLATMLKDTGEKLPVYTQYDHHIGNRTVHGPGGQGAAVLWVRSDWADPSEPHLGALISTACNESYCRVNPRLGGAHAVLKSARMIAAAGGEPLAITDCLTSAIRKIRKSCGSSRRPSTVSATLAGSFRYRSCPVTSAFITRRTE